MIYTKNGSTVELRSYCGKCDEGHLCRATVTYLPGTEHQAARDTFVIAERCEATRGWAEIVFKVSKLPKEQLDPIVRKVAIANACL